MCTRREKSPGGYLSAGYLPGLFALIANRDFEVMNMNKSWNILFLAGLFEIGWVVGLKHANSVLTWILTGIAIYLSMHLLVLASQKLPVGTAYAVFAGIGATGTVILEIAVFGEPFRLIKIILILILLGGVIGLKLVTDEEAGERGS